MKVFPMALAIVAIVVIGFVAVNYLPNYQETKPVVGKGVFLPPIDSGVINATILSFETEPLKEYWYPTFQVKIHVNEIIDYKRFKEADYPPLEEGEELNIPLTFGQRVKQEVTECPKNQTITKIDNASIGTSVICPVLLGPAPTVEESVNHLSNNVGKTLVLFVHNLPNAPQLWAGGVSIFEPTP